MALQDRAECVPVALRCRAASWQGRVRPRSARTRRVGAGLRGRRCRPAPASRGARRTAGTSATGNFAARVEGPLVRRDQRRARAEPVGRRGCALPRTAGARAKSGRWARAARAGSRRATRCVEVAARGECRKARCRRAGARGRRSACSGRAGAPVSPHCLVSDSGGPSAAGDRRRCEIVEGRWEPARASPRIASRSCSETNDRRAPVPTPMGPAHHRPAEVAGGSRDGAPVGASPASTMNRARRPRPALVFLLWRRRCPHLRLLRRSRFLRFLRSLPCRPYLNCPYRRRCRRCRTPFLRRHSRRPRSVSAFALASATLARWSRSSEIQRAALSSRSFA